MPDSLFTTFHFLRPWWLLALLPLLLLVFLLCRRRLGSACWAAVCDAALLPYILSGRSGRVHYYTAAIIAACGVLAIFSLAGPVWEQLPQPAFRDDSALVIALDLSRSMDADDIQPSRLERARFKVADLLKLRSSGQTALVVYAGGAFTVAPLTADIQTIIMQLPALTTSLVPVQGSDAAAALARSVALLKQAGRKRGHILLVTDSVGSDHDKKQLNAARRQGYPVSILAVGTHQGAPIRLANGGFLTAENGAIVLPATDHAALKRAAVAGGGLYKPIQADDQDITALQSFFDRRLAGQEGKQSQLNTTRWREQGPWLLLLILPFAALSFRRGYIALFFFFILPVLQPVHAIEWAALWLNQDQQAMRQFNAGDVEAAAGQFTDLAWKAVAEYRTGNYAAAAALLQDMESVSALYNAANALAKQGKYEAALAAYDRVLAIDPEHQDAQHNHRLVTAALAQQQHVSAPAEQPSAETEKGQEGEGRAGRPSAPPRSMQSDTAKPGTGEETADTAATPDQSASPLAQQQAQPPQPEKTGAAQAPPLADTVATAGRQPPVDEVAQATEQWLRRIPDDPAGLLQRKFYFQYQQDRAAKRGSAEGW